MIVQMRAHDPLGRIAPLLQIPRHDESSLSPALKEKNFVRRYQRRSGTSSSSFPHSTSRPQRTSLPSMSSPPSLSTLTSPISNRPSSSSNSSCSDPSSQSQALAQLLREVESLREQNAKLTRGKNDAVVSLKKIHRQQREMYDSFKLLREKYDGLKEEMHHILWEYLPNNRKQLKVGRQTHQHVSGGKDGAPDPGQDQDENDTFDENIFDELASVNHAIFETPDRIDQYEIGKLLGEGRFADVKLCTHAITRRQLAVKILPKSKVVSISDLRRIQREIKVLRTVRHPNIVKLVDVLHSPKYVYLMMEVAGGKDLFEFFDENPKGVGCTNVAKQIVLGIALPLAYIHNDMGICHRDLKPENILLLPPDIKQTPKSGTSHVTYKNIRICDFGQCARCTMPRFPIGEGGEKKDFLLQDLCGSPGFFAPEMILGGEEGYDGRLADIRSLGCIMLELIRGHDDFCKDWMTSYDYNVLQDESSFEHYLDTAVRKVNTTPCPTNEKSEKQEFQNMSKFLSQLLVINPSERIASNEVLSQPWLAGERLELYKNADETVGMDADIESDDTKIIEAHAPQNEVDKDHNYTRIDTGEPTEQQPQIQCSQHNYQNHPDNIVYDGKEAANPVPTTSLRRGSNRSKRNIFRNSFSSRARKHFAGSDEMGEKVVLTNVVDTLMDDETAMSHQDKTLSSDSLQHEHGQRAVPVNQVEIQLPPIEPNTPSYKTAQDEVMEGERIVMAFATPTPPSSVVAKGGLLNEEREGNADLLKGRRISFDNS